MTSGTMVRSVTTWGCVCGDLSTYLEDICLHSRVRVSETWILVLTVYISKAGFANHHPLTVCMRGLPAHLLHRASHAAAPL